MTTFPPPAATKLATTISGQVAKTALHTQQITTLQTNGATAATNISTLQGQVPGNLALLETLTAVLLPATAGTDPDSAQGGLTALGDSHAGTSPPTYSASSEQAIANRVNDILDYLQGAQVSSANASINRINDLISFLNALVARYNLLLTAMLASKLFT